MLNSSVMQPGHIIHFKTTDSTQAQAKRAQASLEPGKCTVFIADEQTVGKGTRGRRWVSPPSVNIYTTYAYLTSKSNDKHLINIPQVAAFSIVEVLREYDLEPTYKWVNDLLLSGKKVCGILAESSECMKKDAWYRAIYLGIGLNVNMVEGCITQSDLEKLKENITSMHIESGQMYDKNEVFQKLNHALIKNLNLLYTHGFSYFFDKITTILEKFNGDLRWFDVQDDEAGQRVIVEARISGITQQGFLRLNIEGQEKEFSSGRLLKDTEILNALD